MATYTGSEAITVTLVANTVDTITLTGAGTELRISQTSTTPIYIITAQPGQTPATPTVGGAGTTAIMTNYPVVLPWTGSGIVIKVISAGTGTVNFILTTSKFAPQGDLALKADLISPTFTGTVTTATITGSPSAATTTNGANGIGYMGLPQNSATTGAYGVVAADAGTHLYSTATRTITIPANASIAMPVGATIVFVANTGATVTIAITSDTMYLAGTGTTGSRTLAAYGVATAIKITATTWIISGNGLI